MSSLISPILNPTQSEKRCKIGRSNYPGKTAIRKVVEAARDLGIDIAGIEVTANGNIRILDRSAINLSTEGEFEQWDRAGKLG